MCDECFLGALEGTIYSLESYYEISSKCTNQESLTFTHRNPDVLKVITPPLPWPGWTPSISKD